MDLDSVQPVVEVEEVTEFVPRPSTSEKHSSQPMALTIIHPNEHSQTSIALDTVQYSAESSRPSLPPNFEETIGKIIEERVKVERSRSK